MANNGTLLVQFMISHLIYCFHFLYGADKANLVLLYLLEIFSNDRVSVFRWLIDEDLGVGVRM